MLKVALRRKAFLASCSSRGHYVRLVEDEHTNDDDNDGVAKLRSPRFITSSAERGSEPVRSCPLVLPQSRSSTSSLILYGKLDCEAGCVKCDTHPRGTLRGPLREGRGEAYPRTGGPRRDGWDAEARTRFRRATRECDGARGRAQILAVIA